MKKLLFLACMLFGLANIATAQTVRFSNTLGQYYVATLHSSCPTAVATDAYYDVPDDMITPPAPLTDENANSMNASNVLGVSIFEYRLIGGVWTIDYATGDYVSFCSGGTQVTSGIGSASVGPGPSSVGVFWSINTGANTVLITLY